MVSAFRQMHSYLTLPNGIEHSSGLSFFPCLIYHLGGNNGDEGLLQLTEGRYS